MPESRRVFSAIAWRSAGLAGRGGVAVVRRDGRGALGGLDHVGGAREVGFAGAEPDHGFAGGLQGLGLGVHGEGGGLLHLEDAAGEGHGGLDRSGA
jgi:hypothetical protein